VINCLTFAGIPQTSAFYYLPNEFKKWKAVSVNLQNYNGAKNLRFKFVFTSDGGNNILLDDINMGWVLGVNEPENGHQLKMDIYPNPGTESATASIQLPESGQMNITLCDLNGRVVQTLYQGMGKQGLNTMTINGADLPSGIYFVRGVINNTCITQKWMHIE
jgi:hypothetical protein